MPRSDEFASVMLDVNAGTQPVVAEPTDETPFRILVVGDFSGSAGQRRAKPLLVDRDNFEEVMVKTGVRLQLGRDGDERATLVIRELDDFHPDRIYEKLGVFQELRAMRRKLEDASSGSQAIAEARAWAGLEGAPAQPPPPERTASQVDLGALTGGSLLDDVLDVSEAASSTEWAPPRDPLQSFIQQAMAPHLAPRQDPQVPELLARLDEAAAKLMRAILHGKQFQALESAWRALFLMIRRLETGSLLKVYLLDMSRAELAADVREGPGASRLYRLLVEEAAQDPDTGGWAVVAGNYAFSQSDGDAALLARLGRLMRAAGTVFLAEGDLGGKDGEAWGELRGSADACRIGLALPRFLLRLPYGKKTDEVESFGFEEIPGIPAHGDYVWGNPAMACASLLGEAFSQDGWRMRPGTAREIGGMPLHVYEEGGEKVLRPCVELAMTPPEAEWALDEGYMPVIWLRGQDSIRLVRFQSIAAPAAALSGRWS